MIPCPYHAVVAGLVVEQRHSIALSPLPREQTNSVRRSLRLRQTTTPNQTHPKASPPSVYTASLSTCCCPAAETISGPTRMPAGSSPVSTNPSLLGGSARNRARRAYRTRPTLSRMWSPALRALQRPASGLIATTPQDYHRTHAMSSGARAP
jgi:hypothetical protein